VLSGVARFPADPGRRWELVELEHRFVREGAEVIRSNRLARRCVAADGSERLEPVAENRARVLYAVPDV
jgi:hypothetical protein